MCRLRLPIFQKHVDKQRNVGLKLEMLRAFLCYVSRIVMCSLSRFEPTQKTFWVMIITSLGRRMISDGEIHNHWGKHLKRYPQVCQVTSVYVWMNFTRSTGRAFFVCNGVLFCLPFSVRFTHQKLLRRCVRTNTKQFAKLIFRIKLLAQADVTSMITNSTRWWQSWRRFKNWGQQFARSWTRKQNKQFRYARLVYMLCRSHCQAFMEFNTQKGEGRILKWKICISKGEKSNLTRSF